jgi:hypothetical protein
MSEPHQIKQGDTEPVLTVVLSDANGDPIDLTGMTVQFTMRSAAYPYTTVLDRVTASVDGNQVANTGQVSYLWADGDTATAGEYLGDWYVVDLDQTFPTGDYNRITIQDGLDAEFPTPPPVSLGDIETAMGRNLTPTEAARALQLVTQVTDTLALWLNRDLSPTRYTEEHVINANGMLMPYHGPVRAVETIGVDGETPTTAYNDDWDTTRFVPGSRVVVTYIAGDDMRPTIAAVVIDAVAGAILAGPQVATGAISSYSVEGTSITYGTAAGGGGAGAVGRVPVASLRGIGRLRRRVLR